MSGGERELIKRIRESVGAPGRATIVGIGDDAAVFEPAPGLGLITCDAFVDGVHFRRDFATLRDIGSKCMVANVSDIAAMGGFPTRAVVSICVPEHITESDISAIYNGMLDVCRRFSFEIVGGDIVGSPHDLVISIALTGAGSRDRIVTRSGAVVGDAIMVTGRIGGAEAGLRALTAGLPQEGAVLAAVRRHLRPVPRIAEAQAFLDVATPHAMIDISDGLGSELWHLAEESGIGVRIEEDLIPIDESAIAVADRIGCNALELAMGSGEEFELVVAIPRSEMLRTMEHVAAVTGTTATYIGDVVSAAEGCSMVRADGSVEPLERSGYEHLGGVDGGGDGE
jgi:thiamine-monophosphate kinase